MNKVGKVLVHIRLHRPRSLLCQPGLTSPMRNRPERFYSLRASAAPQRSLCWSMQRCHAKDARGRRIPSLSGAPETLSEIGEHACTKGPSPTVQSSMCPAAYWQHPRASQEQRNAEEAKGLSRALAAVLHLIVHRALDRVRLLDHRVHLVREVCVEDRAELSTTATPITRRAVGRSALHRSAAVRHTTHGLCASHGMASHSQPTQCSRERAVSAC